VPSACVRCTVTGSLNRLLCKPSTRAGPTACEAPRHTLGSIPGGKGTSTTVGRLSPQRRCTNPCKAREGEAMFRHACAMGLEGIVLKRARSRYKSGRCLSWGKVKNPAYERR